MAMGDMTMGGMTGFTSPRLPVHSTQNGAALNTQSPDVMRRIQQYIQLWSNPSSSIWRQDDPQAMMTRIIAANFFSGDQTAARAAMQAAGGVPDQSQTRAAPAQQQPSPGATPYDAGGYSGVNPSAPAPAAPAPQQQPAAPQPYSLTGQNQMPAPAAVISSPQAAQQAQQLLSVGDWWQEAGEPLQWNTWMDTNPFVQGLNSIGRSAVNNMFQPLRNLWGLDQTGAELGGE